MLVLRSIVRHRIRLAALVTLSNLVACKPACEQEIQCRTFDVDGWCLADHQCQAPVQVAGCQSGQCQFIGFAESASPQIITVPIAPIRDRLKQLPVVAIQSWGPVALEIKMDGQPASCEPGVDSGLPPGVHCSAPDGLSELQLIAPPTPSPFPVDIWFSEPECTQVIETCPMGPA